MANLKNIKKGDKVILRMFTGAFVEAKVVEMADAKKIGFTNKKGIKMVFDKATGKQITPEPKKPQFANFIEEYDEEAEKEGLAKKNNKSSKKKVTAKTKDKPAKAAAKKKAKPVEEPEIEEDEDFEENDEELDDEYADEDELDDDDEYEEVE